MMRKFLQKLSALMPQQWQKPAKDKLASATLNMAAQFERNEFNCEQVYRLLDEYVERAARGEDISDELRLVKIHLDICPDCVEEFAMLEAMVKQKA